MKPKVDSLRMSMKLISLLLDWSEKKDTITNIRDARDGIITDSIYVKMDNKFIPISSIT